MKKGKRNLLIEIIIIGRSREITSKRVIKQDTLKLIEYETKRVGRPRYNWYLSAIEAYWDKIKTEHKREHRFTPFDINDTEQCKVIIESAEERWGT